MRFADPVPLLKRHDRSSFDCGVASLNEWLLKHSRGAGSMDSAQTYVVLDSEQDDRVVGYHALTGAQIEHENATEAVRKGMPGYPIPAVLLSRLAVDSSVKGQGIGSFLLQDAMVRAIAAAEVVGARLLLVHALDDNAAGFYRHHGFETSPTDPHNLQLRMKDIRASIEA
jgi:GNAT superfamily N-acetyltransferase